MCRQVAQGAPLPATTHYGSLVLLWCGYIQVLDSAHVCKVNHSCPMCKLPITETRPEQDAGPERAEEEPGPEATADEEGGSQETLSYGT